MLDLERALPQLYVYRIEELASSENIPGAMADLDFARSRPVRLASVLAGPPRPRHGGRRNDPELIATLDALCDLEAGDKLSLIRLAEARAECLGFLEPRRSPGLSESERRRLRRRCTDPAMDALTRAVALGYDNIRRLAGEHPGFLRSGTFAITRPSRSWSRR